MKPLLCAFILAILIPICSFGQTIQTGYAIITPVSGTGVGLTVTETFGEQVGGNFFQTTVNGSPLVTLTNVVINVNSQASINTGVAIVNPQNNPATVTLTLGNQQGITPDTRTFVIGAHQQISKFVTELFSGDVLLASPLTGLMFISSNVPIGVLGLAFNGFSFTSLPVAAQVNVTTINGVAVSGTTMIPGTTTTTTTVTSPVPTTISGLPATFPSLLPTQLPIAVTTPITGVAPITSVTPVTGTVTGNGATLTGATTTIVNNGVPTTTSLLTPGVLPFPQLSVGIGGPGSLLLPQVATGAGWVSQITIANVSGVAQVVRVDFIDPFGAPMILPFGSTVQNITLAPAGVATISTAQ